VNPIVRFSSFFKLVCVTLLLCVWSVLVSKQAAAGQFSKIVAIVVATDDGTTQTVNIQPITLDIPAPRIASNPMKTVSTVTRTVCGPNGCVEVQVPVTKAAGCQCVDCQCAPAVSTTTTTTTVAAASSETVFMQRGPARRFFGRVASFIVKGGPIRQALRANRQARRGG
jgi:hypothetical protein